MLNPVLSNFRVDFSTDFFPDEITKKYDRFLFHKNSAFKSIQGHFYENIKGTTIPGINLNVNNVTGIANLGKDGAKTFNFGNNNTSKNEQYPGTAPTEEILESMVLNISFKNSILNWMYCYEVLYSYYKRKRDINDFYILLTIMDSAEIPMIRFKMSRCFIATMPGMEFSYDQAFSDLKSFDCGFAFNEFDVQFIVPDFDLKEITL